MTIQHAIEVAKNADLIFGMEWTIDGESVEIDDILFAVTQAATRIQVSLTGGGVTYENGVIIVAIDKTLLAPLVVGAAAYDLLVVQGNVEDRMVAGTVAVVQGSVTHD